MNYKTFITNLLISLCANDPTANLTISEPPAWQWTPPNRENQSSCTLKTNTEIFRQIIKGRRLRVGTLPDRPPLSWVTRGPNNSHIGHGIAFEILNTLSQKYNFTYDVFIPSRRTLISENGSILNMLTEGKVDMVAAFIPKLPKMEKELQWGTELSHFEYVVMMRRPKESATGSGLLAPFEIEVWFMILISLIIVGPIIHYIMQLRSNLCGGSQIFSLESCFWFVYGALMKQGSSLSPDNDSTRIMFASWWLFIMILTSFYTANLTAFLTLSRFTLPIQSVEDIANPIYKWVALEGEAIEYSVKEDNDLLFLRQSWQEGRGRFISTTDHSNIKKLIADGFLLLHERNWLNYFMLRLERSLENEKDHCKYVLTTKPYMTRSLSFAFPKTSFLPYVFNGDMLLYVESGIIKHLLTKELPEAVICPLNLGSKERQLRNSDLFTTYAIVIIGFFVASIVFTFEVSHKLCNGQLKILNKINNDLRMKDGQLMNNINPRLNKCRNTLGAVNNLAIILNEKSEKSPSKNINHFSKSKNVNPITTLMPSKKFVIERKHHSQFFWNKTVKIFMRLTS